jgi:hypothetical protein
MRSWLTPARRVAGQPDAVAGHGVCGVHDEDSGRSPGNEIAMPDLKRGKDGDGVPPR